MSSYKLTYFNARGRAEIIRLIFAAAGVEYEDIRITRDQWAEIKPNAPFGQIPTLEIDGKTFGQSLAIARYLAKKFNLAGKTELDELRVNMLIDCMEDAVSMYLQKVRRETCEKTKAALLKKFSEENLPVSLGNFEKLLISNNDGDGFLVGDELTWADLAFLIMVNWVKNSGNEELLNNYPKLKALAERVEGVPKVAEWIAKRPVTQN